MALPTTTDLLPPRVDFEKSEFERLILQKGRNVLFSKALQCPCKSKATNQQSNCRNCAGTGWVFVNERRTRMIVQGVSVTTDYKPWSEESRGTINISCSDREQITFMDRLVLEDGVAVFNEVLFFRKGDDGGWYAYSAYPIKEILYAGLFISINTALQRVDSGLIYLGPKNVVKLDTSLVPINTEDDEISLTVRYHHAPTYFVLELKRETMQSFKFTLGSEINQTLPLSAIARRSHYLLDPSKYSGETVIDNSYPEDSECTPSCQC